MLSPLLYCLDTHDCSSAHNNNRTVKLADDTSAVGLISKGEEANYRGEVLKLATCEVTAETKEAQQRLNILSVLKRRKLDTNMPRC